jgi:hypothetical protein
MRAAAEAAPLTTLTLLTARGRAGDRLRFGRPVSSGRQRAGRAVFRFAPDQIFSVVRWRGDAFGTQTWRVVVAQAGRPGERLTRLPGVSPGAHLLLHAFGSTRAKRALKAIDALESVAVLHGVSPAYWRHLHQCVALGRTPHPYDPERDGGPDAPSNLGDPP